MGIGQSRVHVSCTKRTQTVAVLVSRDLRGALTKTSQTNGPSGEKPVQQW